MTGKYTPKALSNILDNPTTNRQEAARKVIESAGGKLTSFYGTTVETRPVLTLSLRLKTQCSLSAEPIKLVRLKSAYIYADRADRTGDASAS
jgi:hypothetical protein